MLIDLVPPSFCVLQSLTQLGVKKSIRPVKT